MSYSKEVISRARARLERERSDRESQNAARLQEAYRKLPRLKEIDIQLRATMASAAQAVFLKGGDAKLAMAAAREQNLALQQERKALEQEHFPQGYLDDAPLCPVCGGTGYMGSTMCECLRRLCAEEQRKELGGVFGSNMRFDNFSLNYYSDTVDPRYRVSPRELMAKNLDHCIRYARSFGQTGGNLLFNGGTGLGKTHLTLAIGAAVGEQGYSVCYESAGTLFTKLERAKFTPSEESRAQAERLEKCDLLLIDDLGTEIPGQFVTAALYNLLNERLMAGKPMIITTNLNVEEASKRYSPQIASRLYGEFLRVTFLGSDIRVLKNRGL